MQRLIPCAVLIGAANCVLIAGAFYRQKIVSPVAPPWEAAARLHRPPRKPISGTLRIDPEGVEFRSKDFSKKWAFLEIHTFDLSNPDLTLTIYENRRWHEPGERRFHFTLQRDIPAAIAAVLTEGVERPVRNGAPDEKSPAIAEIPARHSTRFGGSNGMLRFRESGIDYVSSNARDSRSWRWSDLQTIANPDPYTLRVTAYREIDEFELKRPLSRSLFDTLWNKLYAADLNVSVGKGDDRQ